MNSKTNTFRIGRLSHTSDFKKHSISEFNNNSKQKFKLAALTSITRGIKHNDLSFITGHQLPKLRKQPEENGENLQYAAVHDNLTTIRKKYDNIKKQKLQTEAKINLYKEQKEKYQIIEDQYLSNKTQGNSQVKSLEDELNRIKLHFQQNQWNKKILLMSSQRIKHDRVIYDQRKFNLEKELQYLKKQLKIFAIQGTEIYEQTDRTTKIYQKFTNELQAQQNQRESHLLNLTSMLNEKMIINQKNTSRKNQIQQIALKAMQDKDENQKSWISILNVNKFVSNLLKNKMNKQMQKFSLIEMAFKNIKIATGVSQAKDLIIKFLNKQQVYSQLLSKIVDNQKKIEQLKQLKQYLLKQNKNLKQQKQQYIFNKKQQINLQHQIKLYQLITQKNINTQLYKQKIRNWIIKNLKKIFNIEKINDDVIVGKTLAEIAAEFKKFTQVFYQLFEKCIPINLNTEKNTVEEVRPDSKMFRVKAKTKKLNMSGQQFENQFDDQDLNNLSNFFIDLDQEQNLILSQRSQILKQNQKFMKDLKKKIDQLKKLKIQTQPKKKLTTSPEKKSVQILEQ